ncbi:MAG: arylsulfatase [Verrucomicrobiota bacterium]
MMVLAGMVLASAMRHKVLGCFCFLSIFGLAITAASEEMAGSRPNILFVLTDDQGMGDLACLGNKVLKTPHLDALYQRSARFTDFQVSPTCAPTRAALMSGKHPFYVGVTHTIMQREKMALDTVILPQVLKQAGYSTGIFGKWHLGDDEEYLPQNRGFDEVLIHGAGGIGQSGLGDFHVNKKNAYFDNVLLHNDRIVQTEGYCTDLFFRAGLAWLKEQSESGNPWFAMISLNAPHAPMIAPEKNAQRFLDLGYDEKTAGRYGMVENIDENMGLVLSKLKEWQMADDCLVIFMTDNGGTHLSGTLNGERVRHFNFNMRGAKNSPNEGGTHVPSFWSWKGRIPEGKNIDQLTAHLDVFPTLCQLAGAPMPNGSKNWQGRSLLPLFQEQEAAWADRKLFVHCARWKPGQREKHRYEKCAVRTERWRLVNHTMLYDILKDPSELTDVAKDHPDVVAALQASFDEWWEETEPYLINENLPKISSDDQPLEVRYRQQLAEQGIPKWNPKSLE